MRKVSRKNVTLTGTQKHYEFYDELCTPGKSLVRGAPSTDSDGERILLAVLEARKKKEWKERKKNTRTNFTSKVYRDDEEEEDYMRNLLKIDLSGNKAWA